MPAKKTTKKTAARNKTGGKGFTKEERAAMKERAKELKAEASEADLLAKIDEMPKADRDLAKKIHAIVKATAPSLESRTWYGMPAYAKDGKVVCFFQAASKFGSRYATFGFSDEARLDNGNMWPASFALTKLTSAEENKIKSLVKKAVS